MPRQFTQQALREMNALQSGVAFFNLITITHVDLGTPIRIVANNTDVISRANTYLAYPVQLSLPVDDGEALPSTTITVDNVDRLLMQSIRTLSSAPQFLIEMVLSSDPDIVELVIPDMFVRSADYNMQTVTLELGVEDLLNIEFPAHKFTPQYNPGLF